MMRNIDGQIKRLRKFVDMAGKSEPVEKLALELADQNAALLEALQKITDGPNTYIDGPRMANYAIRVAAEAIRKASR